MFGEHLFTFEFQRDRVRCGLDVLPQVDQRVQHLVGPRDRVERAVEFEERVEAQAHGVGVRGQRVPVLKRRVTGKIKAAFVAEPVRCGV
ncbi:hypothetical protein SDC9_196528 [bioreactor metagenome]|uniref:Uncharacterized protein n=1 Tax=bioreactor metagenome TaxID=1076179 RepID=A0A645ICA0_9ZZZZ